MKSGKALFIAILVFAVYLVHQDYWNWKKTEPLIFGFLPIGLAYHAAYSILAAILMAVLVRIAWPKHLEDIQSDAPERPGEPRERH